MDRSRRALVALFLGLLLHVPLLPGLTARADALWTPVAPPATVHAEATTTLLPDGQVLVIGGTTAERYDPAADRWRPAGTPTTYHSGHTATALAEGQVLVVGGFTLPYAPNAAAERYDPVADRWTTVAPPSTPRIGHTATLLPGGQVLVVGGSPNGKATGLATAERYDPATDRWTAAGAMGTTRADHTATPLPDGRVLVAGGTARGGTAEALNTAEIYDPATGAWTPTGSLRGRRLGQRAAALPDGRVLVMGGDDGRQALDSAEVYDPATGAWTPTGAMTTPRIAHSATPLPGGQVLVAGGSPPAASATTELYDPATGRWTPSAQMRYARLGHAATLLADGRVLVVRELTAEVFAADVPPPPKECFAATGKCVGGRFLAYWRAHGDLALNGYPLTDEMSQVLEDGQAHTVQYFERTRLEYHPRNAPPYDVTLGQFGRRLHPADPPSPPAPDATSPDVKIYFPEAGHTIQFNFLAYWRANGGLAQFGYPLSEEFVETLEDGNAYTVQYFERARFERHPENAPPYDVTLGQFGRRILAEPLPRAIALDPASGPCPVANGQLVVVRGSGFTPGMTVRFILRRDRDGAVTAANSQGGGLPAEADGTFARPIPLAGCGPDEPAGSTFTVTMFEYAPDRAPASGPGASATFTVTAVPADR